MNITKLKPADNYEVQQWIEKNIVELTAYQKQKITESEMIRFSHFYFYKKRQKEKVFFLWRLTILFFPIYIILVYLSIPIKFLFTGKWGLGSSFINNVHSKWTNKIGL